MKKLSKKQILMLHTQLIQQTGGSDGVRDYNLLDSALENPFQSFGGEELYPTIQAKAVRLGYGLIKNHCMIDGNKRIRRQGSEPIMVCCPFHNKKRSFHNSCVKYNLFVRYNKYIYQTKRK